MVTQLSQMPCTGHTDKRILRQLDKPPPEGFARWTGPLLAEALGDVDVQYVWRFLRSHKIDLAARKSGCESNDPICYSIQSRCVPGSDADRSSACLFLPATFGRAILASPKL